MSINDIKPQSIARHRQEVDPKKQGKPSSHGYAALQVRKAIDKKVMRVISADVDSETYFDQLMGEV